MKKIILIITILFTIFLSACDPEPEDISNYKGWQLTEVRTHSGNQRYWHEFVLRKDGEFKYVVITLLDKDRYKLGDTIK